MRKSIVEQATENYLNARAITIDEELFAFLRREAVTESRNIEDIQSALKHKGLELVRERVDSETEEVHVFKLCRVFAERRFNIPKVSVNKL